MRMRQKRGTQSTMHLSILDPLVPVWFLKVNDKNLCVSMQEHQREKSKFLLQVNNKGADETAHRRSLIRAFLVPSRNNTLLNISFF